jgi:hypothetical protein
MVCKDIFECPEKHEQLLFSITSPEVARAGPEIPPTVSLSAWLGRREVCAPPLHEVNFGAGNLTFGVKKAVEEFATKRKKNISIDWLGD